MRKIRVNYLNRADRSDPLNRWRVLSIVVARSYVVIKWGWRPFAMPSVQFGTMNSLVPRP